MKSAGPFLDACGLSSAPSGLRCEGVPLEQIIARYGTPTYLYSARTIRARYHELKSALASHDSLICFAVKSCSNLAILKLLAHEGAGMDIVSGGELFRGLRAGVPAHKIVFSGVGKTPDEIAYALRSDIHSFHIESGFELDSIARAAQTQGKRARVAFRFNPDVNARTHPYISTGLKQGKFGLDGREILALATRIKAERLAIDLVGLSIHIGSQMLSLAPLAQAIQKLLALQTQTERAVGHSIEYLDIGGGLGIPYKKGERGIRAEQLAALLKKSLFKKAPKLLVEPGRWILGNSGVLLALVIGEKRRGKKRFVIIDAGMNDLIRPALYKSHHEIVPLRAIPGAVSKADVVGPVCESSDFIALGRALPTGLKAGAGVAILSAGAYGFSMSSQYNSRPRAAEVLVDGNEARLIRRRERFDDLIQAEEGLAHESIGGTR